MTLFKLTHVTLDVELSFSCNYFCRKISSLAAKYENFKTSTLVLHSHRVHISTFSCISTSMHSYFATSRRIFTSNFITVDVSKLEQSWFFTVICYYTRSASRFVTSFTQFIIQTNYIQLFKSFKSTQCIHGVCWASFCYFSINTVQVLYTRRYLVVSDTIGSVSCKIFNFGNMMVNSLWKTREKPKKKNYKKI